MLSLGIILVILGFGLSIGSFYYEVEYQQQMRIAGVFVTIHGWVVIMGRLLHVVAKNHDIQMIRIVGEPPWLRMGDEVDRH
jgi:hypothetical protein